MSKSNCFEGIPENVSRLLFIRDIETGVLPSLAPPSISISGKLFVLLLEYFLSEELGSRWSQILELLKVTGWGDAAAFSSSGPQQGAPLPPAPRTANEFTSTNCNLL